MSDTSESTRTTNPFLDLAVGQHPFTKQVDDDLLWDEDSTLVVEQYTLGTDQFVMPEGPDDTEVYLAKDSSGVFTTIAGLRSMHEQSYAAQHQAEIRQMVAEQSKAMQEVERERVRQADPRAALKDARRREIVDYVRVNPDITKNEVYKAVGGKRSTTLTMISELVEGGALIMDENNRLRVPA